MDTIKMRSLGQTVWFVEASLMSTDDGECPTCGKIRNHKNYHHHGVASGILEGRAFSEYPNWDKKHEEMITEPRFYHKLEGRGDMREDNVFDTREEAQAEADRRNKEGNGKRNGYTKH